ncbi:MAG TPA: hypothetical protein VGD74_07325, partial [Vulgatibacter sp.]
MRIVQPKVTVPIHNDDYTVFKSSLEDFANAVRVAGLEGKVRYVDRGDSLPLPNRLRPSLLYVVEPEEPAPPP